MKTLIPILFAIILINSCKKEDPPITEFCWKCIYTTITYTPEYIQSGYHYPETIDTTAITRHYCDLTEGKIGYIEEDYTYVTKIDITPNVTRVINDICTCEKVDN